MSSELVVDVQIQGEDAVLVLSGEIDMMSAGALHAAIDKVLDARALGVAVDLCDISFIDSTGIHELLRLRRAVGDVCLVRMSEPVRRVLEVSGVRTFFSEASSDADSSATDGDRATR